MRESIIGAFIAAFLTLSLSNLSPVNGQAAAPTAAPGEGHGFLIDKHIAAGFDCAACHAEMPPSKAAPSESCSNCHGPAAAVAALTAEDTPNPHAPSHIGDIPCEECHHVHKASESLCDQCHSYGMSVP